MPDTDMTITRREPGRLRRAWGRRWVRILAYLAGAGLLGIGVLWVAIARDLPSVEGLRAYEPPLPTNVRDGGGVPIHSYARLRRVELGYAEYPPMLVKAFLAAEDRTFFEHHGVDYPGIVAAMITNLKSDKRPIGASTITQQVAKNLLVGNEVSYVRKAREAMLAYKIEDALTKQQILELYLNQIELGRNAAGVEAAAHAYFDKELDELTLAQLAYLAILPKGPSNYNPDRNYDRAIEPPQLGAGRDARNGFITQAPARRRGRRSRSAPRRARRQVRARRRLFRRGSPPPADRPLRREREGRAVQRLFGRAVGADVVRPASCRSYAQDALRQGLLRYDGGRGWSGPLEHK